MRRMIPTAMVALVIAYGSGSQPGSAPTRTAGTLGSTAYEAFSVAVTDAPQFSDEYVRDKAPEVFSTIVDETSARLYTRTDRRTIAAAIIESRRDRYDLVVVRFFRQGTEQELAGAGFAKTKKATSDLVAYYGFRDIGEELPTFVFRDGPPS